MKKKVRNLILGVTALTLIPTSLAFGATNAKPVISGLTATPAITKQVTQTVSLKFQVSEASKVSINIYKSGKLVKNGMNKVRKSKGLVTYNWTGTKSNGIYTIKVDATDLSGLKAVTKSLSVNFDTVKPVISSVATDLDTNYIANGDGVNFLVKLLESSTVNVRIYGGAYPKGYTIVNKFCNAGVNQLTWNGKFGSLVAKDGAYNVVFTATDKAGNVSVTKSVVITKDSVAPVINTSGFAKAVFNPAKGSNNFSFTASEPVQFVLVVGPKNSDPFLNPLFGGPETEPAFATTGSLAWDGKTNITAPFTQVPDGEYVSRLIIIDKAGNISSVDAPVKVDTANPLITEANIPTTFIPTGSNNSDISFNINEAGIAKVEVVKVIEGVETVVKTLLDGNKAAGVQTIQWDGKDNNNQIVTPGTYQVKISLTDAAGNQADVVTGNVEIIAAATKALEVINAGTETFADFATAGVTGAVEANKAAYDTAIAAAKVTKGSDLILTEVQNEVTVVNTATALAAINAGTESFADFATAGVTDAVEANKAAYDTAIAAAKATKGSDLILTEVQTEIDAVNTAAEQAAQAAAQAAALAAINAGTESFTDFATAGVTGVVEANKTAYDTAIAAAKATKGSDLTLTEVQTVVDDVNEAVEQAAAQAAALAAINVGTESFADFTTAGVTGAVEANIAAYDTAIAAAKATKGSDLTLTEVQNEVSAVNTAVEEAAAQAAALAAINAGTEVFADFATAGVTGAVEVKIAAYDTAIAAAKATKGSDLTLTEVQAEVDAVNAQ